MAALKPKPDEKVHAAIRRLQSNYDFQQLCKYLEANAAYSASLLITVSDDSFQRLQGRAQEAQALHELLSKVQ